MRLQEIGYRIRKARLILGWTQARLASQAGVSRTTLNQLENGLFPDIGVRKLERLVEPLGLTLTLENAAARSPRDYVRMASTSASVSHRNPLTEDELIRALLTGKAPSAKRAHLRVLLDEASPTLLKGLVEQVSRWTRPGRVERNVVAVARDVGSTRAVNEWLQTR